MKAIRIREFGKPPVLEELPDPSLEPGQVLVDVMAAGVNPVDAYVATGTYAMKPDLPYTPGMDAAGVVREVGSGVTQVAVGDRVIVCGTAAGPLQGAVATACVCEESQLMSLPEQLSYEQGAAVNIPYVTAFRALLDHASAKPGDRVLIRGGTGAVGLAAVQIARAHKLPVYATGGSEQGRAMLEPMVERVTPHDVVDFDPKPTIILTMLANKSLPLDLETIAEGGRIVVIGSRGDVSISPRKLMGTRVTLKGMTYFDGGDAGVRRAMGALQEGLDRGDLKPKIQKTFDLADVEAAWKYVMDQPSAGKVVLTVD